VILCSAAEKVEDRKTERGKKKKKKKKKH